MRSEIKDEKWTTYKYTYDMVSQDHQRDASKSVKKWHQRNSQCFMKESCALFTTFIFYGNVSSYTQRFKEVVSEVCEKHRSHRAASCDLLIKGALHWFGLASNEIFRGCHIVRFKRWCFSRAHAKSFHANKLVYILLKLLSVTCTLLCGLRHLLFGKQATHSLCLLIF